MAESIESLLRSFQDIYKVCLGNGLVATKTEFAALIGANRSVVTAALNGDPKYLTPSLLGKATQALADRHIVMNNRDNATGNVQNNYDSTGTDINAIVDKLVNEMAAQRESYERIIIAALQRGQNG